MRSLAIIPCVCFFMQSMSFFAQEECDNLSETSIVISNIKRTFLLFSPIANLALNFQVYINSTCLYVRNIFLRAAPSLNTARRLFRRPQKVII